MGSIIELTPKVRLDGEADFKKSISNINKDLAVLQSELKLSKAEFAGNNDSMAALSAQGKILQERFDAQTQKVETMRDALEKAKASYGENSDKVKDWQIKLNTAEAQLANTRNEIDKNAEAIKELSQKSSKINELKESFTKLKDKASELHEKCEPVEKALKKVSEVSFKAITGGMAAAAAGVAAVGGAAAAAGKKFVELAGETASAGDTVDKMSQRLGVSAETYQELDYALQLADVDINSFQTGIKSLVKNMDAVSEGNNTAIGNFKKLGVSATDSKGKLRDQESVLLETLEAFQAMPDSTEKSRLAMEMFGKQGQELLPLLNSQSGSLQEAMQAAQDLGMVMSNDAVAASAAYQDSLSTLKDTFSGLKNNMMADFLPGITDVMDGLTGLLSGDESAPDQIKKGLANISENISQTLPEILDMVKSVAPELTDAAIMLIGELIVGLVDSADDIADTAFELINTLSDSLLEDDSLTKLVDAGIDLIVKLAGGLLDATPNIIDAAFELFDGLIDALLDDDNMDDLVDAALDIVVKIGVGLVGAVPKLLEAAWELCKALVKALIEYDWKSVGSQIWQSIKNAIIGGDTDGSHAVGLAYVPFNNYKANLHEGERVLTAAENEAYTASRNAQTPQSDVSREEMRLLRKDVQELSAIMKCGVKITNAREVAREMDKRVAV